MTYWLVFITVTANYPMATVIEAPDQITCEYLALAGSRDPEVTKPYCVPKTSDVRPKP